MLVWGETDSEPSLPVRQTSNATGSVTDRGPVSAVPLPAPKRIPKAKAKPVPAARKPKAKSSVKVKTAKRRPPGLLVAHKCQS